ncbi:ac101 [Lambdina fiscellaria nucleopolyhedrovirus]|uniref:Ac101 n=1 Tax=Lambdina fiscellaria nucleopolyhedrovirus TaxID=1642929 RepID=A0A0E3Z7E2_9ABAC|nr:ac101 [Lambdina fiscellaria nucleopolyhedrovirus]AKC91677.1 ac101 [Lambdina fiscellaria nucleopolyhedrovirus]
MSAVDLFNQIVILRDKIDPQMQMGIWLKLFRLLDDDDEPSILLSFTDFTEFLVHVATLSKNRSRNDGAALVSEFASNGGAATSSAATASASTNARRATANARPVINLFDADTRHRRQSREYTRDFDAEHYRKTCQRVLQYYTLTSTATCEFQVSDLVMCMLYLSRIPQYKPLYALLEHALSVESNECMPHLEPDQMYHIIKLLRILLNMQSSAIDSDSVRLLRAAFAKIMHYPLTRFPRITILPDESLNRDRRCTIEELITEKGRVLSKLVPEQSVELSDKTRIPYCDDEDFINELLKITDNYCLPRMFYNASNSIFYTTMENYAVANCKMDFEDYNNIFKVMDEFRQLTQKCGGVTQLQNCQLTDSLNIYLGASGSTSTPSTLGSLSCNNNSNRRNGGSGVIKRKKY